MIDDALLAYLKDTMGKFLTETCTIERRSRTTGEFGEPTQDSWETVASGVACRVITARVPVNAAAPVGTRETLTDTYRLICPAGTALSVDQRVTVSSGAVYQVTALVTARTDETDTQAVIERLR